MTAHLAPSDPDQLKAIGAGDAYRGLLERHPSAGLENHPPPGRALAARASEDLRRPGLPGPRALRGRWPAALEAKTAAAKWQPRWRRLDGKNDTLGAVETAEPRRFVVQLDVALCLASITSGALGALFAMTPSDAGADPMADAAGHLLACRGRLTPSCSGEIIRLSCATAMV